MRYTQSILTLLKYFKLALLIRADGRILCAAMHKKQAGDTYIDDDLHYQMSVIKKVICTEESGDHSANGEWWWAGNIPENIKIDSFYINK